MKIEKILGEELSISVKEIRKDTHNYAELVFFSKDVPNWNKILSDKFGQPVILEDGAEPVSHSDKASPGKKHAEVLADCIGGVRKGQSLYYGTQDSHKVLIMMWPWKDNNHVTLKKISYHEDIFNVGERRVYQRRALRDRRRMVSAVKPKCPNRRYHLRRLAQDRRFLPPFLIHEINKMSAGDAQTGRSA